MLNKTQHVLQFTSVQFIMPFAEGAILTTIISWWSIEITPTASIQSRQWHSKRIHWMLFYACVHDLISQQMLLPLLINVSWMNREGFLLSFFLLCDEINFNFNLQPRTWTVFIYFGCEYLHMCDTAVLYFWTCAKILSWEKNMLARMIFTISFYMTMQATLKTVGSLDLRRIE